MHVLHIIISPLEPRTFMPTALVIALNNCVVVLVLGHVVHGVHLGPREGLERCKNLKTIL